MGEIIDAASRVVESITAGKYDGPNLALIQEAVGRRVAHLNPWDGLHALIDLQHRIEVDRKKPHDISRAASLANEIHLNLKQWLEHPNSLVRGAAEVLRVQVFTDLLGVPNTATIPPHKEAE